MTSPWGCRILYLLALTLLVAGAWRSLRLAIADRLYFTGDITNMSAAIRIEPRCALYPAGLADQLTNRGEDGRLLLRQAVALNPRDADFRIRLGLEEELASRPDEAERQLLSASTVSAKHAPRWALTNFYYRQGDQDAFWRWARASAAIYRGDRRALFDLCWRTTPDPAVVLDRAIPPDRSVQMDYASYLTAKSQWAAAEQLLDQLSQTGRETETGRFLSFVDQALASGRVEIAVTLWNRLSRLGAIPHPELDVAAGQVLTNGDFQTQPVRRGFDWRMESVAGIYQFTSPDGVHRLSFSGSQPEDCRVLWRFLPLAPGQRYRMTTVYRTAALPLGRETDSTGLRWTISSLAPDRRRLVESEVLAVGPEMTHTYEFTVPGGVRLGLLDLHHRRVPGRTRMAGEIRLESARLELLEPVPSEQSK